MAICDSNLGRGKRGTLHAAKAIGVASVAAFLLAGCSMSGLSEELGFKREGPDEFTVVSRKPLTIPQDRTVLPVPEPGVQSLVDRRPSEEAALALGGSTLQTADTQSAGERALLQGAAADNIDPEVRAIIEAEAAQASEDQLVLDRLFGDPKIQADTLDAAEETRRIAAEAKNTKNPDLVVPPEPVED
ncbi:MAG: DUF3035 domain-containing protein [Pseudomonadota bacterium]